MTEFEKALQNPQDSYTEPKNVITDKKLTKEQKLQILKQWEYDARELMVAEEENMQGEAANILQQVLHAIHEIDPSYDSTHSSGSKQGGSS